MTMLRYADKKNPLRRKPVVTMKPPQMALETLLKLSDDDCVQIGKDLGKMYATAFKKERNKRLMEVKQKILEVRH